MNEKIQVARNRLMCSMLSLSVEGPGVQIHPGQNIFEGFTFYNAVIEGIKFNLSVHKNHRNPSRWQLNPAHVSSTVVRGGGYQELLPPGRFTSGRFTSMGFKLWGFLLWGYSPLLLYLRGKFGVVQSSIQFL